MNIKRPENCGNAPKNFFIEEFIFQLFGRQPYQEKLAENVVVEIFGLEGVKNLTALVPKLEQLGDIAEVQIFDGISHGKKGAIDIKIIRHHGQEINIGLFLEFKSMKADSLSYIKMIIS